MDTPINVCPYCGKGFSKARTLQVHLCEPKRRHLQKDEKWVINGFMVFQRFYQIHQNATKPKSYEDFCKSPYYNAFVKFGRYMMHIHPLYPEKYIDYIIMSKVKLDHWARDDLYETYLIDTLKLEPLEAALLPNACMEKFGISCEFCRKDSRSHKELEAPKEPKESK